MGQQHVISPVPEQTGGNLAALLRASCTSGRTLQEPQPWSLLHRRNCSLGQLTFPPTSPAHSPGKYRCGTCLVVKQRSPLSCRAAPGSGMCPCIVDSIGWVVWLGSGKVWVGTGWASMSRCLPVGEQGGRGTGPLIYQTHSKPSTFAISRTGAACGPPK